MKPCMSSLWPQGTPVICPSGGRAVESFISDFPKNICCHLTQIKSRTLVVPAHRGAFRDRHGRWAWDAVDAAALGAQRGCRAGHANGL